jgi:hypothetical protein
MFGSCNKSLVAWHCIPARCCCLLRSRLLGLQSPRVELTYRDIKQVPWPFPGASLAFFFPPLHNAQEQTHAHLPKHQGCQPE